MEYGQTAHNEVAEKVNLHKKTGEKQAFLIVFR